MVFDKALIFRFRTCTDVIETVRRDNPMGVKALRFEIHGCKCREICLVPKRLRHYFVVATRPRFMIAP